MCICTVYSYIHILMYTYTYGHLWFPVSSIFSSPTLKKQDFDKKLSHVNRGASSTKPVDGAGGAAGLDTMAEAANGRMDWKDLENHRWLKDVWWPSFIYRLCLWCLCMTEFIHEVLDGYDNKTVLRLCSGSLEAFEVYNHYALIIVMNKIKRVIQWWYRLCLTRYDVRFF